MRKIFSILFALVLAVSLMLVPAVVSANPGNGDVTIIVQNQAGVPIEGAQVNLYWSGGDKEAWMPAKITDANGTATFTAAEIAAFHGTSPRFQVYAGDNNGDYGNVYTVSVANE